uniref:Uncharacterized protein n=1 Tax=Rhizophora mucronata TaxID=61149 RepID=A0A2P2MDT3_RHIMU
MRKTLLHSVPTFSNNHHNIYNTQKITDTQHIGSSFKLMSSPPEAETELRIPRSGPILVECI